MTWLSGKMLGLASLPLLKWRRDVARLSFIYFSCLSSQTALASATMQIFEDNRRLLLLLQQSQRQQQESARDDDPQEYRLVVGLLSVVMIVSALACLSWYVPWTWLQERCIVSCRYIMRQTNSWRRHNNNHNHHRGDQDFMAPQPPRPPSQELESHCWNSFRIWMKKWPG